MPRETTGAVEFVDPDPANRMAVDAWVREEPEEEEDEEEEDENDEKDKDDEDDGNSDGYSE